MRRIKVTNAQESALVCSGMLEWPEGDAECVLRRCWRRELMELHVDGTREAELCWEALNGASNGESDEAENLASGGEHERARQSRGASRALQNLASKVLLG